MISIKRSLTLAPVAPVAQKAERVALNERMANPLFPKLLMMQHGDMSTSTERM